METKPTHEQTQLHLQVYDLRREAPCLPGTRLVSTELQRGSIRRCHAHCGARNGKQGFCRNGDRILGTSLRIAQYGLPTKTFLPRRAEFWRVGLLKQVVPEFRERFADRTCSRTWKTAQLCSLVRRRRWSCCRHAAIHATAAN